MRVAYLRQFIEPPDRPGAYNDVDVVDLLAERGHEVLLVRSAGSQMGDRSPDEAGIDRWGRVDVLSLPSVEGFRTSLFGRLRAYGAYSTGLIRPLRRFRPDLVVSVCLSPTTAVAARIARPRARHIVYLRDLWPDAAVATGAMKDGIAASTLRVLSKVALRSANEVIAVSDGLADAARRRGARRVAAVPQGAPLHRFPTPPPPPDGGEFVIAHVGNLGFGNNDADLIVEAARLLERRTIRFEFVGSGERRDELADRVRRTGPHNVIFRDPIPSNRIGEYLAGVHATALTLPPGRFFEMYLQTKFFDFLAAGRPIVAAVAGEQAAWIRDAGAGIVGAPGDVKSFADSCRFLADHPEDARVMGDQARKLAEGRLARAPLVDTVVSIIERVGTA